MRKALLPMIASLALCGAATVALIATNAHAEQTGRKPVMLAAAAQDGQSGIETAAPGPDDGAGPDMMRDDGHRRAEFCKAMYAHKVGELAFMEAQLTLTPAQQPLFEHGSRQAWTSPSSMKAIAPAMNGTSAASAPAWSTG